MLSAAATANEINFTKQIAPILAEHCVACHSDSNSKGDVSLATVNDLQENGYLSPGDPNESHLIDLIVGVDGEPPAMPKEGKPLADDQVTLIRQWVAEGANWPSDLVVREKSKADDTWWSLQPIDTEFKYESIDEFVDQQLVANGLTRNPSADRRSLIRRATYDLIGLPPTPKEVNAFVDSDNPKAYEKLVDHLLDSPHYGERWGRHWLDVVRFGESIGYERNVIINNVWPFRDYVIRSINADKPFDQFIREHLAGDVFGASDPDIAVGTAFLVAGPYDDVGNQDAEQAAQIRANTLDEIIRATSGAFLGLTIGCARCHDHKFDPILQSDYYSLYATFAGVRHGSVELGTPEAKAERAEKLKPLQNQQTKLESEINGTEKRILDRAKAKLDEYRSQWPRPAVDRTGTEEKFSPVTAKFVRLVCEARDSDLKAKSGFRVDEFEIYNADGENIARRDDTKASGSSRHIEDFDDAYSAKLAIDGHVGASFIASGSELTIEFPRPVEFQRIVFSSAKGQSKPRLGVFAFVAEYRIEVSDDGKNWREIAHGRDRQPTDYSSHEDFRLAKLETTVEERKTIHKLRKDLAEVKTQLANLPRVENIWIGRRDSDDRNGPFHIFLGGSPQKKGEKIVPQSLNVVKNSASYSLDAEQTEARRRTELADWVTGPVNPLTARVLANRLWHYHFGTGVVDTPNDFGYMGGRPTHPKLLDFLATKLIENGWRLKPMHRMIMLSKTYRQSTAFHEAAAKIDGDARLLWRFPPRRLSAEEIRDTVLMAAGKLKRKTREEGLVPDGGPGFRLYHFMQDNVCTYAPLDEHGPETYRRSVYHQNARASVVDLMSDFDQPDCTFSAPRRSETTTPLQALTMLNHRFTMDMAKALSERLQRQAGDGATQQVEAAYQICYGRNASPIEIEACTKLAERHGITAVCRVLLNTTELIYVR